MANAKEIQDRMKSINDTLKITNAMYMISSSKLKKSKKMLTDTEPYFFTLQSEMSRILRHLPDLDSIYFRSTDEIPEEEKRIAYMVVTADKGLAGSYNHNILKIAEEELVKHPKRQLYVLGEVGRHYFEERGIEINKQFHYTIQNPTLNRARNISEELLDLKVRLSGVQLPIFVFVPFPGDGHTASLIFHRQIYGFASLPSSKVPLPEPINPDGFPVQRFFFCFGLFESVLFPFHFHFQQYM